MVGKRRWGRERGNWKGGGSVVEDEVGRKERWGERGDEEKKGRSRVVAFSAMLTTYII